MVSMYQVQSVHGMHAVQVAITMLAGGVGFVFPEADLRIMAAETADPFKKFVEGNKMITR